MKRTIWKYALTPFYGEVIEMPRGATVAHVGHNPADPERPAVWMLVDPDAPPEPRGFAVIGTGHPMLEPSWEHIGSAVCGPWVWHVFAAPTP